MSSVDSHTTPPLIQTVLKIPGCIHGIDKREKQLQHSGLQPSQKLQNDLTSLHVNVPGDVDFQKQLDEIALWFEKWSHSQRCNILEHLILIGDYSQFQLLWTAVQPVLHRDFMFTAKHRFPDEEFTPVSTQLSRASRERLTKNRLILKFYRAKSMYVRNEIDVKEHSGLLPRMEVKPNEKFLFHTELDPSFRLPSLHRRKSLTNPTDHLKSDPCDPTASWRTTMQVRRHLQTMTTSKHDKSTTPLYSRTLYFWYSNWTAPKRATFLQLALMKLDPRQLYFLSTFLSVRRHRDLLSHLPSTIAHNILSFLSPTDLSNCSKVSRNWQRLCEHNAVWHQKCKETHLDVRLASTPKNGGWRSAYRKDRMLKLNWRNGNCTHSQLIGHTDSVLCIDMNSKMIVSGGKDTTVRIWSTSHGFLLHTFFGHQKGVWAVTVLTEHLVASGSYDRTVKIWGFGPSQMGCLRTLYGHHGAIWTMVCKKHYLATGSQDRLIKLWDIRHCTLECTFNGHTSAVFSMDADEEMSRIYTGSADKTIRIWNVAERTCMRVIWTGEPTSIMSVSFAHGLLAAASGGQVTVWDPSTGKRVRSFKAHKQRIEAVKLRWDDPATKSAVIITGGKDGRLKYWSLFGKGTVKKLDQHNQQINALCADSVRIVSASYDNSIILWDFRDLSSSRTPTRC